MGHTPVLHYRVLQFVLLLMVYWFTVLESANGPKKKVMHASKKKLDIQQALDNKSLASCEDNVYLAGIDSFRFTEPISFKSHSVVPKVSAPIYIGNETIPKDFQYCELILDPHLCPPPEEGDGCYCKSIPSGRNGTFKYLVTIQLPLSMEMANGTISMWYQPTGIPVNPTRLFNKPIPKIIGTENITLAIDGREMNIVNRVCPSLPGIQTATIKFCVYNLQSPSLRMHIGNDIDSVSDSGCQEKEFTFKREYMGKSFWMSFRDSCNRHGTINCHFPRECCRASLPAPVTLTLMIALTMSSLLTQVN